MRFTLSFGVHKKDRTNPETNSLTQTVTIGEFALSLSLYFIPPCVSLSISLYLSDSHRGRGIHFGRSQRPVYC